MRCFFTHNKQSHVNSSTLVHPLPPPPPLQCWTCVDAISPELQQCIGQGGGEATHLKGITVLFQNSAVLKTQKITAITQESQGILSTIVILSLYMNTSLVFLNTVLRICLYISYNNSDCVFPENIHAPPMERTILEILV